MTTILEWDVPECVFGAVETGDTLILTQPIFCFRPAGLLETVSILSRILPSRLPRMMVWRQRFSTHAAFATGKEVLDLTVDFAAQGSLPRFSVKDSISRT